MASYTFMDDHEILCFLADEPMIGYFFLRSRIKEDKEFPFLAAVYVKHGIINLMVNPDKMNALTTMEKMGVMVHEYLHVMLLHCTERSMNNTESAKATKENIAKDMAINQLIVSPGCWSIPEQGVFHNKKPFDYPAKLSAEEYYMLIEKDFTDEEIKQNYDPMDDHSQWGEDSSPEEAKSTIKALAKAYANTKDAMKRGKVLEHGKGVGWMPGDMLQALLSIETPDVMWQTYVKMFMQKVLDQKKRFTYKRFSRRYGAPFQGTTIKTKSKVCAIIDTSGSMSDSFLAHIGGQLNLMCRIMQVDVVFCDAAVQGGIAKFKPSKELAFPGRGGTDMNPAFKFAEENLYRGIVCFTDGGLFTTPESTIPTLWVVVNNNSFKQPFGEICHVEWK